jgi:hypothetical protein
VGWRKLYGGVIYKQRIPVSILVNKRKNMSDTTTVTIKPPNFQRATFKIVGAAPLVIHRFSSKVKNQMKQKMEEGKASSSKKNRDAKNTDKIYDAFERYANGDYNRLASFGICGALHKLERENRVISDKTYWTMDKKLCADLIKLGFEPLVICWPTTPEGAASRCEFIRKHFLPPILHKEVL